MAYLSKKSKRTPHSLLLEMLNLYARPRTYYATQAALWILGFSWMRPLSALGLSLQNVGMRPDVQLLKPQRNMTWVNDTLHRAWIESMGSQSDSTDRFSTHALTCAHLPPYRQCRLCICWRFVPSHMAGSATACKTNRKDRSIESGCLLFCKVQLNPLVAYNCLVPSASRHTQHTTQTNKSYPIIPK